MIAVITADKVRESAITALGLDASTYNIGDPEVMAALVRRAASMLAPCPPREIRERVLVGLNALEAGNDAVRESVDATIEALTSYGDLIELLAPDEGGARAHLYVAPPTYVETTRGTLFLLGIATDGQSIVPESITKRIQNRSHTRRIRYDPAEALPMTLRQLGLQELPEKLWFKQPANRTAMETRALYDAKLDASKASGDLTDLLVLNPATPVRYYRGRWELPKQHTGRFVARRQQRYGAPLWSYIELKDGSLTRLYDLLPGEWRGCDLAWQLQMAIDAMAGSPQLFAAELTETDTVVVKLFSPVPSWWQRRWAVLGMPVKAVGCLLAYELDYAQYVDDLPRMKADLWLTECK